MRRRLHDLMTMKDLVKDVMETAPATRSSDNALYVAVLNRIKPGITSLPLAVVLANVQEYELPQFETVRRSRQKVQAEYPELCADADVEAMRMINQEDFEKFALR